MPLSMNACPAPMYNGGLKTPSGYASPSTGLGAMLWLMTALDGVLSVLGDLGLEQEPRDGPQPAERLDQQLDARIVRAELRCEVGKLRLEGERHRVIRQRGQVVAGAAPRRCGSWGS